MPGKQRGRQKLVLYCFAQPIAAHSAYAIEEAVSQCDQQRRCASIIQR